jgi:hypothetical protein
MSNLGPLEIEFLLQPTPRAPVDGIEDPTRARSGRLPRVTKILALAIELENMIRVGDAKDYADLGRLSCQSRERISQIMRLTYLAPEIQVELLYLPPTSTGRYPISETQLRKIANLLSWEEQRQQWVQLKELHGVK